jgi:hypothetical protein
VFPRSGYAIFRDAWHDAGDFAETVYLSFKCGFLSNYHRHDDDLSLVLFAFGEEWLIDSGLFGYEENHPIRRYMRSPEAHNTVVLAADVIRNLAEMPAPGSGMIAQETDSAHAVVTGRSLMYRGFVVERRVDYLKPDKIVLHDQIMTRPAGICVKTNFAVLFHTPADKRIVVAADHQVVIASTNGHRLLLSAHPEPQRVTVIAGEAQDDRLAGSWVSEGITKVRPSQCVRLEFAAASEATCTLKLVRASAEPKESKSL